MVDGQIDEFGEVLEIHQEKLSMVDGRGSNEFNEVFSIIEKIRRWSMSLWLEVSRIRQSISNQAREFIDDRCVDGSTSTEVDDVSELSKRIY